MKLQKSCHADLSLLRFRICVSKIKLRIPATSLGNSKPLETPPVHSHGKSGALYNQSHLNICVFVTGGHPPQGEDFSVRSETPSYTNQPAMDTGDTKNKS
jgi:hypothetical protein